MRKKERKRIRNFWIKNMQIALLLLIYNTRNFAFFQTCTKSTTFSKVCKVCKLNSKMYLLQVPQVFIPTDGGTLITFF